MAMLFLLLVAVILVVHAEAKTDTLDALALHEVYKYLNQPPQLTHWTLRVLSPCDELWLGVTCSGSSVTHLNLHGLNLTGILTAEIHILQSLKHLDVSSNSIGGEIPNLLPPSATYINLACNRFTQNIPQSLPIMKVLRHLNLSHNMLSEPIQNVFTGLQSLREDLSCNNFSGDLPRSFASLTNLNGLYLHNNNFTGSVNYLSELPLIDVNIKDNKFSGIIPSHWRSVPNLWIGGNSSHLPEINGVFYNLKRERDPGLVIGIAGAIVAACLLVAYCLLHRSLLRRRRRLPRVLGP